MRKVFGGVMCLAWLALASTAEGRQSPARVGTAAALRATNADLAQRDAVPRGATQRDAVQPAAPSFDHSAFDALLRAHVQNGLVDYAAFRNNAAFTGYLAALKAAKLDGFEEAERIAFWLNVYNAYTIQLVSSRGETESIRNIDKALGLFRLKGPWSNPFVEAAGRTLTLDDVEHRILRHDFSEPRVHFAMSFAARSGPVLRSEAYTGALLEEQLDDQARTFLRDETRNRVDTARRTVYISPVIARYRSDFGETPTSLGRFLADYYPDGPERRMLVPLRRPPPRVAPGPPTTPRDSAVRREDSIRVALRNRRVFDVWFRVEETPFDWGLNGADGRNGPKAEKVKRP